jgi:hypothetical protein
VSRLVEISPHVTSDRPRVPVQGHSKLIDHRRKVFIGSAIEKVADIPVRLLVALGAADCQVTWKRRALLWSVCALLEYNERTEASHKKSLVFVGVINTDVLLANILTFILAHRPYRASWLLILPPARLRLSNHSVTRRDPAPRGQGYSH